MITTSENLDRSRPVAPIVSLHPIELPMRGRPVPLQLRVTAPESGRLLPVLLISHGHGPSNFLSSYFGYAPIADYFAARGFVVIQPTHLDSKTLPYRRSNHEDAPLFWRSRVQDLQHIVDELEGVERAVPLLAGRLDLLRVAVLGHSMGGHTASVLLGAQHRNPQGAAPLGFLDRRIKAGVILSAPGRGEALTPVAAENYPFFQTIDFSTMVTPALVVAGDRDLGEHLTTAGPAWFADAYTLSPEPKALLTVFEGGHGLGGVSGYDAAETTDESPERVAGVLRTAWAFLRSQLLSDESDWLAVRRELSEQAEPLGRLEEKGSLFGR